MPSINQSSKYTSLLLVVLLLPLFFVHINNGHDWGDDFAQYLVQSRLMSHSGPVGSASHLYDYGPSYKGTLFSVFLIPAILNEPNEIQTAKILVTFSLVAAAVFFLLFLLKFFPSAVSLITTLLFCYNHYTLGLKDQVLPDIMLSCFFLMVIFFSSEKKSFVVATILAVLAIGVKSAGVVAPVAMILYIISGKSPITEKRSKIYYVISIIAGTLFMLLVNRLFWDASIDSRWYLSATKKFFSPETILSNAGIYRDALGRFFEMEVPFYINTMLKTIIFPSILAGLLIRIFKSPGITEFLFAGYLALLLLYPYNNDPIRFLIPIVPICLFYMLVFLQKLLTYFRFKKVNLGLMVIVCGIGITNIKSTGLELQQQVNYPTADKEAGELFEYIKSNISTNDTLAFEKPWALSWYTNRNCVPAVATFQANWLVIRTNTVHPGLFRNKNDSLIVFKNNAFSILRIP